MSITNALSIATHGLNAANARAQVAADNVANAHTPGYVRRTAILAEATIGGRGDGVRVLGTDRVAANGLIAERMRMAAQDAGAQTLSSAVGELQAAFGKPGDQTGLFDAFSRFETALRDSAATPESATLLEELASSASGLSSRLAAANSQAANLRNQADRDIGTAVSEVNDALERLGELNRLPARQVTPAVLDERQRLIDEVNTAVPVKTIEKGAQVHLMTEGGAFLLTDSARPIVFDPAGVVGRSHTLGGPLSGLTVDGIDITPTGSGPQRSTEGRLAALFTVRDETAPAFQDQLDAVAADVFERFALDGADPTKTPGQAGLFTDGASTAPPATTVGLAGRLRLNAAVDPAAGGEVRRLRDGLGAAAAGPKGNGTQLGRLLATFEAGGGVIDTVADLSADLGAKTRTAAERAVVSGVRLQAASDAERGATGVDVDSEMQDLLSIERAYAANARVIQTVSDMLDILMGAVR